MNCYYYGFVKNIFSGANDEFDYLHNIAHYNKKFLSLWSLYKKGECNDVRLLKDAAWSCCYWIKKSVVEHAENDDDPYGDGEAIEEE